MVMEYNKEKEDLLKAEFQMGESRLEAYINKNAYRFFAGPTSSVFIPTYNKNGEHIGYINLTRANYIREI